MDQVDHPDLMDALAQVAKMALLAQWVPMEALVQLEREDSQDNRATEENLDSVEKMVFLDQLDQSVNGEMQVRTKLNISINI